MNKFKYKVLVCATAMALATSSKVMAVDGTLNITTTVAQGITITLGTLDFGNLFVDNPATVSSFVLNANGTNGTETNLSQTGTPAIGTINIAAQPDETVDVSAPSGTVTLSGTTAGGNVGTFNIADNAAVVTGVYTPANLYSGSCVLDANGHCNLNIGGTISLPANVESGTYTATATITVVYQ